MKTKKAPTFNVDKDTIKIQTVMSRDHFKCQMCGDTGALNIYPENSSEDDIRNIPIGELITLCKYCRKQVKTMLLDGVKPIYFLKI